MSAGEISTGTDDRVKSRNLHPFNRIQKHVQDRVASAKATVSPAISSGLSKIEDFVFRSRRKDAEKSTSEDGDAHSNHSIDSIDSIDDPSFKPGLFTEEYFWQHYYQMSLFDHKNEDEISDEDSNTSREIIQILLEQWCFLFDDNRNSTFIQRIVYFSVLIKASRKYGENWIVGILRAHYARTGRMDESLILKEEYEKMKICCDSKDTASGTEEEDSAFGKA